VPDLVLDHTQPDLEQVERLPLLHRDNLRPGQAGGARRARGRHTDPGLDRLGDPQQRAADGALGLARSPPGGLRSDVDSAGPSRDGGFEKFFEFIPWRRLRWPFSARTSAISTRATAGSART
jgi:hypothetical protein